MIDYRNPFVKWSCIYNKECALAHSGACGVAECQWHSFSNDRSEAQTLATSSLYAAVRILPEAFHIIGNAISYYMKKDPHKWESFRRFVRLLSIII